MKKWLFLLLILATGASVTAQNYTDPNPGTYGFQYNRLMPKITLLIPTFCGTPTLNSSVTNRAGIAYDSCNHKFYTWDPSVSGTGWVPFTSVPDSTIFATVWRLVNDSTILRNLINGKVNIADTLAMLAGYQRSGNPVTVPAQPNITSVGTLTGLTVSGLITAGTVSATITQPIQPNITQVGTLGNLTVSGNISAGTISGTLTSTVPWSKITSTPTTRAGYGITDVPLVDGTGAGGTWSITVTGNAGTVTNGVYTTGSYANPSWITSLDWSKITSTPTTLAGYGITDAIASSSTYYIGTTLITFNRASASQSLTGVSIDGNAGTATALQTARTINGTSFNGTANITITANTPNSLTAGTHLSGGPFNGGSAVTLTTDATNANTASTIVARDGSGNFSAGTISAALSGNASTATALQTARTINGVSFDGTANITITSAVPNALTVSSGLQLNSGTTYDGSAARTISIATGGVSNAMLANSTITMSYGTHLSGSAAVSLGSTLTISNDATALNTVSTIVSRDGSGSFAAGDVSLGTVSSSGNIYGTTKGFSMGRSGGDYASMGYNVTYTGSTNTYNRTTTDFTSMIRFDAGGMTIRGASSAAAGSSITFTELMSLTLVGDATFLKSVNVSTSHGGNAISALNAGAGNGGNISSSNASGNGLYVSNSGASGLALYVESNWTGSAATNDIAYFQRQSGAVRGMIGYSDATGAIYFGTKTDHPVEIRQGNDIAINIATDLVITLKNNLLLGNTGSSSPALITFQNSLNGFTFGFNSTTTQRFVWNNGAPSEIMSLASTGLLTVAGGLVVNGANITSSVNSGGFYHSVADAGIYASSTIINLAGWSNSKGIHITVSTGNTSIDGLVTSGGGFAKSGSSDSYILLGGGGTALLSSLGGSDGEYTPTVTNVSNTSGSTPLKGQYLRVGNRVTVSGYLNVTSSGGGATVFYVNLPVASATSGGADDGAGAGTASAGGGNNYPVLISIVGAGAMGFSYTSGAGAGSYAISYTYTYKVN